MEDLFLRLTGRSRTCRYFFAECVYCSNTAVPGRCRLRVRSLNRIFRWFFAESGRIGWTLGGQGVVTCVHSMNRNGVTVKAGTRPGKNQINRPIMTELHCSSNQYHLKEESPMNREDPPDTDMQDPDA